jgi:hypothetical protein
LSSLVTRAATLYSDLPTYGRIYSARLPARDYRVAFGGPPFTDVEYVFDGSYTKADGKAATAEIGTEYRVLLRWVPRAVVWSGRASLMPVVSLVVARRRALKITADPLYQDGYESWLSPPFSFTA